MLVAHNQSCLWVANTSRYLSQMAYELKTEHHSQHLGLRPDYGSYSFPKRRQKDEELLFRVIQRLKEEAEVQVLCSSDY